MQTVPEIGQLAIVRKRPFVVTEIIPSALGLSGEANKANHLIKLSSVEDDGLGEELQVIWELEPGTTVHEKSALPDPGSFDHPKRLQAFLDAVRWGAVSQADDKALQSPFRSGIEVDEYQLDPVVRALSMPRVNLLIADDVGLGKTIEAGLVVQEMILRHPGSDDSDRLPVLSYKYSGRRRCETSSVSSFASSTAKLSAI